MFGKIFNLEDGSLIATLSGHTAEIRWCDIKKDDSEIVTAAYDGTIR